MEFDYQNFYLALATAYLAGLFAMAYYTVEYSRLHPQHARKAGAFCITFIILIYPLLLISLIVSKLTNGARSHGRK